MGLIETVVSVTGDSIPPVPSDEENPSIVVAGDSIPPAPSDVEDPSLGVTDGGMLGRGLPSQGSLVGVDVEREVSIIFGGGRKLADLVVGHPGGSFAKAEAIFEELKVVLLNIHMLTIKIIMIYLNLHTPHASKRENMNAITSFMVYLIFISLFQLSSHFTDQLPR